MFRSEHLSFRIPRPVFFVFIAASIASCLADRPTDVWAQANLDPGQLSGPVRIGTRAILGGTFRAYATAGSVGGGAVNLNGTMWNGTDFTGPLDPFGYVVSVQALDPDTNAPIPYAVEASDVQTSSGLGDIDYTRFPWTPDVSVTPNDVALAVIEEPNPWILDAEIVNIGPCPNTHFAYFRVDANAHINTKDWAGARSEDSQGDVNGAGLTVRRYLDMPLLPGPGGSNVYEVRGTAHIGTSGNPADGAPIVMVSDTIVSASDVVVDGMGIPHIHVIFELDFDCQCPLSSISGTIALNGITPADGSIEHYVDGSGPSFQQTHVTSNPAPYTIAANMQPGNYAMRATTYFSKPTENTVFTWPYSTHRGYEGFYYEAVACNQNGSYSFEADAAAIEGKISYTCQAELEPALVEHYDVWSYGMFEGLNPDGSHIGSYGGQSVHAHSGDGHYRMIASAGTWNTYFHRAFLRSTNYSCCGAHPTTAPYVFEDLYITERQLVASSPSDPTAIHLNGGDVFHRDFSYEIGKVTIFYTITGSTPAERLLANPAASIANGFALDPVTSEILYTVDGFAQGTSDVVEVGQVTIFLPKGEYTLAPSAKRILDGSSVSFPPLQVSVQGCVDVSCSVSCPSVDWIPRADACGGLTGEVTGTASEPDGWSHISYRVNHVPPGADTTDGYVPFVLVPTGGPDNEVSFTAPLTLQPGSNDVEVEAVDGDGNRYYEHRTVYRSAGGLPVLTLDLPLDGSTTDHATTLVTGTVSADVKIDAVTVNGTTMTLTPDPDSSNPYDRVFTYTLSLTLGANDVVVHAVDVCGGEAEESRSVTRLVAVPTAIATFTPSPAATATATGTGTPTPTVTPTSTAGPLDHFGCFETHRPKLGHAPLNLTNALASSSTARLKRAKRICAPADKNGEDPSAPTHPGYLTAYTIMQTSPRFQPVSNVGVSNQFGTVTVDVVKPDRLLVPTSLSATGAPVPLAVPADHFECYRVKGSRSPGAHVNVATALGTGLVDVKKPLHLCVPVDKNGEGIIDPSTHLFCYRARASTAAFPDDVSTSNQFGLDTFGVFGLRELCVPSTIQR